MNITLQNLTKRYKHTTAVHDLSFHILSGEFLVVLGSSGSGKSTTLNMLAGLETPTTGHIFFNECIVNQIPPGKRDVALVFQNYALYPHMKIFDNIAFPLKIRRETDIQKKVEDTAKMLGIHALLEKYPRELSGGERQRVALARALVRNPQVFLMDEPLSNLDARLRLSARGELKKLQKQRKITTVYVTHDQIEALTLGDRIAIMDKGRLQQIGTPVEIYQKPHNIFVACFIGSPPMNIAQATIPDAHSFILFQTIFKSAFSMKDRSDVILGIRPEKLNIVQANTPNSIPCTIESKEYLGHETITHVKIDQKTIWYIKNVHEKINTGDTAGVQFSLKDLHWFDTKTGVRLNYE